MQMAHINDQKERYGGSSTAQTIHSQARNESKSTPRPSPYLQSAAWASQQNSEIDVTSSSPVSPLRPAHFPVRSGAQSRQSNGSHSVTSVLSSQLVSSRQSRAFGEDFRYKTVCLQLSLVEPCECQYGLTGAPDTAILLRNCQEPWMGVS